MLSPPTLKSGGTRPPRPPPIDARVYMYVCVSVVCLRVCVSACLRVCVSACLRVCVSACLRVCVSACLRVCLSACLRVCVSACLRVCVSACLRVCVSACLRVCPRARVCVHVYPYCAHSAVAIFLAISLCSMCTT